MKTNIMEEVLIDNVCETMKLRATVEEVVLGLVEISRQLDELISIQKAESKRPQAKLTEQPSDDCTGQK